MSPSTYRGRFAPSPTGPLHFGSLLAAFGSWLMARQARGRWLVRIEDIDPPREVPCAADEQLRTLQRFGLVSDEPVLRQSERGALYREALDHLLERGDAFECHCSRSDLVAGGGVHRACMAGRRRPDPAIRLRVPDGTVIGFTDRVQGAIEQDVAREVGDFVLRRADGPWAYQLAVVVDDAAQGVTEVVRGADLLDSTARQIFLQRRLGLPSPGYAHLPLVVDAQGHKLSKSSAALPVDDDDPLPALRAAWTALGQLPSAWPSGDTLAETLEAAVRAFDPGRIPSSSATTLAALHNACVIDAA
ncbi:tRNA glutamyl-Q(34) synthetase GluQRS [Luteimonas notoginsengisoli]|uniref:Glutamyl-Q tRNA(Asp) synthetase n=1 Tax=Luteimonas notoginsengisoli TaxID=1578200 RepID=A0ABV7UR72_9GAMM